MVIIMKKVIELTLLVISIPFFIVHFFYNFTLKTVISGFNINKNNQTIRVLKEDNTVENLNLEDYLIGVVSSEVPVYFEKEALKAQAVAARTYALKQIQNNKDKNYDVTDNTSSQVYQDDNKLREKWKDNYETNINKVKECVNETKGEYITYDNEIIYAFFFSTSNGKTEDNKNVFGKDLPYLKIVDSSFDKSETSSFETTKELSLSDFYNKLGIDYSDKLNITDEVKTDSGRIYSLKVNNIEFKGREFQSKLSLRSNDFQIMQNSDKVIIKTKGFGHGVGMSQYGANALAKQNKTYQEILKYYYQGTEIQKF